MINNTEEIEAPLVRKLTKHEIVANVILFSVLKLYQTHTYILFNYYLLSSDCWL